MNIETFPWASSTGPLALSFIAVIALVSSDMRQWRPGRYLFKPLAAAAFLWLALSLGCLDSGYGRVLLLGLILCSAGDILLMFEPESAFLAGLIAFLSGHLVYAYAFYQLPLNLTGLWWSIPPALILIIGAILWLHPHLQGPMRVAVPGYMIVISAMLLFAGMTSGQPGATLIIAGAWGFALSDLAVARRQFINPTPLNGLWGTPLYFWSQILIAASVAYH
jgi:uncharacterized membrane protein YhhN